MIIFNFMKKDINIKRIYHTGAWAGNFGDSILEQSIRRNLQSLSKHQLDFIGINCQRTEFTTELIDEINKKGDMLIIGGGGLIFFRPQDNSKSGWQWNIDINLIDAIKIPIVVYGIGYNQFEYDTSNFISITDQHLQKTVEKAALFSVRNTGTKRELINRGCNEKKIMVIPDSGMFLQAKHIDIPGLKPEKLKIAFNWTTDRENQTFSEPFQENQEKFISSCLKLLNYLISERNAQVFYVGHMGNGFDEGIIEKLKKGLIEEPIVIDEVLSNLYPAAADNAEYLVDVYKQMDITLGMRGHANIVSFGQNTPMIGIGSHRKIRYFLEDVCMSKYYIDVRLGGTLYTNSSMKLIVDDMIENIALIRKANKKELIRQKKIFVNFNKKVLKLLQ